MLKLTAKKLIISTVLSRSSRWETFFIPAARFREIAKPVERILLSSAGNDK